MNAGTIERRHHRRVDLEVPIEVRTIDTSDRASESSVGRARNVSLAGCFALLPASAAWAVNTPVSCTLTIPQEHTQQFPFVRLVGKGWIVRVTPASSATRRASDATGTSPSDVGLAINFVDVIPLTTLGGY